MNGIGGYTANPSIGREKTTADAKDADDEENGGTVMRLVVEDKRQILRQGGSN